MGERLQSLKGFVCSFLNCNASFSKSWKLEAHLCKHTGLKPFACESCDKSFSTRYQLTRHKLSHSGEKPHKCLVEGCDAAFFTNAGLKNHITQAHEHQKKQYQCDYPGCGKEFSKRYQLRAHQCEHNSVLPFHCTSNGCTKEFPSRAKLKHHEKMHQGYPCEEEGCPFQGQTWTEYQTHKKDHRVKLPCEECKKLFNNAWLLRRHQLGIHSEKKVLVCPREGCDKKFTLQFRLESHVLGDHEGKKPFSCAHPGCGRSFATEESLWRHGAIHDQTKKKMKKLHFNRNWGRPAAEQVMVTPDDAIAQTLAAKLWDADLEDTQ
ncbi:general transcription factor IIIA, b [Thalassophryne amazonica]|uniref:general transcription factor IIIA, b n=1 Tax=Thalassophryne amazonica TaxID=390379 RepID=UPI00147185FC|nr:general transcription factor IIIA, b [Thalassophryne amazonica]